MYWPLLIVIKPNCVLILVFLTTSISCVNSLNLNRSFTFSSVLRIKTTFLTEVVRKTPAVVLSKIDFSTGDKEQIDFIVGERIASFTNEEAIFDKKTVLRDNVLMGDINTVYVSYQKVAKGYDVYVYTNENVDVSSNIVDIAVAGYAIAG